MEIVWRERLVKPVACLVALVMLVAAARMLWVFLTSYRSTGGLIAVLVLIAVAIGVLRDRRLALRCAAAICVLMAFILPVGIFNPFAVGDYLAQGHEPPSVSMTLIWLLPIEVALLFATWIIDPPRKARQADKPYSRPPVTSSHSEETNLEPEDLLSSEEESRTSRLSAEDLARIDASLLSHARPQSRKLAMIVALAMGDCGEDISNVPDAFYSRRAARLVSEGKLVASGDLQRMRYCEVRLPES